MILDILWIEPGGHGGSCVHHGFPVAGVSHVAGARDLSRVPRPWRRGHRAVTPGLHRHRVLAPEWGRGLRGGQGAAAPGSGGGSWREKTMGKNHRRNTQTWQTPIVEIWDGIEMCIVYFNKSSFVYTVYKSTCILGRFNRHEHRTFRAGFYHLTSGASSWELGL